MKISKIHIENFKSIKKLDLEFPNSGILSLVGPNNAGKSNTIRAINNLLGESWINKDRMNLSDFYNRNKDLAMKIEITFDNNWKYIFDSNEKWPKYLDENGSFINQNHVPDGSKGSVKEDFPCTYLPATRTLEDNMQFHNWNLMGKIAKDFHTKALSKKEILEDKFKEIMQIMDQVDGFQNFKNDFIRFFEDMQSDSPYKLRVDFKAFTPLNYFKNINILANDKTIDDEYNIGIEELGEGNKNLILFALVRSYAKNFRNSAQGLLALEEPEIYLHPQARRHLFSIFNEIVRNSNIQIILTTHSDSFLETEKFNQIGLVSKTKEDGTTIKQLSNSEFITFCNQTGGPRGLTSEKVANHYAITSNNKINEAFFSKYLILVEGDTEECAFPIFFKKLGLNCDMKGVSIIGVDGITQIPKYWRLFYSFKIPISVVVDNDSSKSDNHHRDLISSCFNTQEIDLLADVNIYKVLNTSKVDIFDQKLIVLDDNYEKALQKDLQKYCQDNNKEYKYANFQRSAGEKFTTGDQKGYRARFIAMSIVYEYPDYTPSFILKIHDEISRNSLSSRSAIDNAPTSTEVTPPNTSLTDDLPF